MTAPSIVQRLLIAIAVVALGGVAAVLALAAGKPASSSGSAAVFDGPVVPAGLRAASFSLTDQQGRRLSLNELRDRVVLVTFLHTRCAETCPLTAETIRGALDLLPPAQARSVSAVAITAAPSEDTALARRAFVVKHHLQGRLEYLNGSNSTLGRVWNAYHVLPEPTGARSDVHTTFTMLIDRRGIERVGFPDAEMTSDTLAHDLSLLVRRS